MEKIKSTSKKSKLIVFKFQEAIALGFSRRELEKKFKSGEFIKLGRGIYLNMDAKIPHEHIDFIEGYYIFGKKSIICGLTALFYHNLLPQPPSKVWIMVNANTRTQGKKFRLLRVNHISQKAVEFHEHFKITNIERSIVEAFKYSSKIGLRTAIVALANAINAKQTTISKIMETAKDLEAESVVKKHWEIIIGTLEG